MTSISIYHTYSKSEYGIVKICFQLKIKNVKKCINKRKENLLFDLIQLLNILEVGCT